MKTIEQVKEEIKNKYKFTDSDVENIVYTILDFTKMLKTGVINPCDGNGFFHNGEEETNVSVFSNDVSYRNAIIKYPYVCWYNK